MDETHPLSPSLEPADRSLAAKALLREEPDDEDEDEEERDNEEDDDDDDGDEGYSE